MSIGTASVRDRRVVIAPSLLAADFARLGEEIAAVEAAGADWLHLDVMDGHFVPNITFGPPVIKALRRLTKLPFDVHLMIAPADPYLTAIKALGKKAGVSLCPATPEDALRYVLDGIDLVLVMTVNPGFGGQSFLASQLAKIRRIREMIGGRNIHLELDGGVTAQNARRCIEAGADVLVAGSAVFKDGPRMYAHNIAALRGGAA